MLNFDEEVGRQVKLLTAVKRAREPETWLSDVLAAVSSSIKDGAL
jgi:hypothetical protein